MTIDREQLISLLAERTGFDQERVDEQFMELVDRIQQAEEKQNTLHIEGFGTFKCINDWLEFEPAEVLETEINNKYTGMKPIELIGAFKEPGGTDVPIADLPDEEEVLDYKDLPEEQQVQKAEPEETAAEEEKQPERKADVSEAEKQEEIPKEEGEKAPPLPGSESEDKVEAEESLQKDPLGKAILILAIIIALAVAGWMAYDLGLFGSNTENGTPPPEPVEEQTQDATVTPNASEPDQNQAPASSIEGEANQINEKAADASTDPAASASENNEPPASSVEDTPYGLYGELNKDISTGYFTIVVHSLRTMDLAEEKKQGLVKEGFRTKINKATVNDQTYFRVGIGQFPTVKAAQEAVQELPEPYKNNNFINRF